jgi:hypothetical protein
MDWSFWINIASEQSYGFIAGLLVGWGVIPQPVWVQNILSKAKLVVTALSKKGE